MSDDSFFAMPPAEGDAPEAEPAAAEGGFTMVGEAAPMLGDVNEIPASDMLGFAAAPEDDMHAFAAPPAEEEETPIILGAPAPEENIAVTVEEADPEMPIPPPEPSIMQKWNEDWQTTLTERKDEENSMKAQMIEDAKAFTEKFAGDKEAKREAKMSKNREDEQAKLEAIEADLENDNSWQRVCKMVELSHDGANDTEDVKRMRDVLILLKNEPARAEAVGA